MQRRRLSAALLTLGLLLATAIPAAAHARLEQKQVPASSEQELTVVVPGEREGSLNTSVEVLVPAEFADVACGDVAGWSCATGEGEGGGSVLSYERDDDGDPEAPLAFTVGTPDEPGTYRLPTIQVYDDGTEVAWIQTADGAERPAPALEVVAADGEVTTQTEAPAVDHGDPAATEPAGATTSEPTTESGVTDAPSEETGATDTPDEPATVEATSSSPILAIILAVVALGGVIAVFVRRGMSS